MRCSRPRSANSQSFRRHRATRAPAPPSPSRRVPSHVPDRASTAHARDGLGAPARSEQRRRPRHRHRCGRNSPTLPGACNAPDPPGCAASRRSIFATDRRPANASTRSGFHSPAGRRRRKGRSSRASGRVGGTALRACACHYLLRHVAWYTRSAATARKLPSRTILSTPGMRSTVAVSTACSRRAPGLGGRTTRACTMRGRRRSCT